MNEENLEFLIQPTPARQLCLEVESFERKIKKGELDGIPKSEITLLWMETVTRKDQYKLTTGLHYEQACEISFGEKRFLSNLFLDTRGYSWASLFGWVGQIKTLTRNAVDVFEASSSLYDGVKVSSFRSESFKRQNGSDKASSSTKNQTVQPMIVTVKGLDLSGNGCDGDLNNQLNAISACVSLNLSNNLFSGSIPTTLTSLNCLESLNLSCNQFSGLVIPRVLSGLAALTSMDLSFNELTGDLPDCFDSLPLLESLNLSGNQLSGELPTSLSCLTNLRALRMYSNELSGAIPDIFSGLQQLRFVNLSQNHFTKGINAFNSCSRLEQLQLNNNCLRGRVDPSVSQLQKLDLLYLHNNQISGVLPNELCALTSLRYCNISNNQLRGCMPVDIGNMGCLESLLLFDNAIIGPVPISVQRLQRLKDFSVFKAYKAESSMPSKSFDKVAFERTLVFGPSLGIDSMHWDFARVYGRDRDARDDDSVTLFSGTL